MTNEWIEYTRIGTAVFQHDLPWHLHYAFGHSGMKINNGPCWTLQHSTRLTFGARFHKRGLIFGARWASGYLSPHKKLYLRKRSQLRWKSNCMQSTYLVLLAGGSDAQGAPYLAPELGPQQLIAGSKRIGLNCNTKELSRKFFKVSCVAYGL